ncbi:MAG TPA: ribonuclease III domain-containing protein, partial [Methylomirabilota bacterium]|nr:ribonuclease III domain-containing protein [Methylomirabilota bacterium]
MALLDSHGIDSFRVSGHPQGIWPMAVSALGEIRVAVAEGEAEQARRVIESHRQDVGARVVRLRDEFDDLQTRIAYRFRDRGLLEHALTHKSRAAEDASGGVADNESLEFLGDAVLGLVVADRLITDDPAATVGELTTRRSALVTGSCLARWAAGLELGALLRLGRGEDQSGGRVRDSILASTLEAVLGAVYRDGGLDEVRLVIGRLAAW